MILVLYVILRTLVVTICVYAATQYVAVVGVFGSDAIPPIVKPLALINKSAIVFVEFGTLSLTLSIVPLTRVNLHKSIAQCSKSVGLVTVVYHTVVP